MVLSEVFNGDIFRIRSATVLMDKPETGDNGPKRLPREKTQKNFSLIEAESVLRRLAYKNTTIKTEAAFFDDSDMLSEYYLTVIYDKRSGAPLLTSRYYFNKQIIERTIRGDENKTPELIYGAHKISGFREGDLFLADRLSGNVTNSVYRRCRAYIFLLYYSELLKYNPHRKFIIMARKERSEKLLRKYQQLGFETIGLTKHKGKEHWILKSDFRQSYSRLRGSVGLNFILIFRGALFKI